MTTSEVAQARSAQSRRPHKDEIKPNPPTPTELTTKKEAPQSFTIEKRERGPVEGPQEPGGVRIARDSSGAVCSVEEGVQEASEPGGSELR